MTEYLFRLQSGRARLIKGDAFPTDCATVRFEDGRGATLLLSGKRIEIPKSGALLKAQQLPSGMHKILFLSEGVRFEGPTVVLCAGTIFLMPPSHERMTEAEDKAESAQARIEALEKRLAAIESRIQNTNIF
jgi:hypothetical protein